MIKSEKLDDLVVYHIMEEDELQGVLDKINKGETFSSKEVLKLLRQVIHWKELCKEEQERVKFLIQLRNK